MRSGELGSGNFSSWRHRVAGSGFLVGSPVSVLEGEYAFHVCSSIRSGPSGFLRLGDANGKCVGGPRQSIVTLTSATFSSRLGYGGIWEGEREPRHTCQTPTAGESSNHEQATGFRGFHPPQRGRPTREKTNRKEETGRPRPGRRVPLPRGPTQDPDSLILGMSHPRVSLFRRAGVPSVAN